ncbi:MAG: hypothetical protein ACLFVP_02405 [Candidatus Bathyarchaeia archaeon]
MDAPSNNMGAVETSQSRKIATLAILTSTALSTNYLLIGVSNIKLMDLIVFVSGFLFGPGFGLSLGILIWLIYGTLNPYGFSLPILAACMMGEALYGLSGGFIARTSDFAYNDWTADPRMGIIGFIITFIYDLFTNLVSALTVGIPITVALISGIPFALVHEVSNAFFFAIGVPSLVRGVNRFLGGFHE